MRKSPLAIPALTALGVLLSTNAYAGGFVVAEHAFYLVDFLVIAYFIRKFGAGPLRNFLENRRATVLKELDEAERLHAEAEARLQEYESKLADLESEKQRIKEGFIAVAEQGKARIVADAEAQAKRMVDDAAARIQQEGLRLRQSLETQAIEMALTRATEKVTAQMTPARQRSLMSEAIQTMETLDSQTLRANQK